MNTLLDEVKACTVCKDLPLGPRPILQISATARLLIVGQAPGRITHQKGIPFDDPSGNRLRSWLLRPCAISISLATKLGYLTGLVSAWRSSISTIGALKGASGMRNSHPFPETKTSPRELPI
ncbi:uracil-DNA glycosylase family protein [Yoonia maritima]|uniref:uracil-DNA glycosylase family protein n=1 Tax=Yoonia maritima TaxID=1435347 RepID=UPI000D0FF95C